jgi:Mg2+/Co2+ transporter CorB
MKKNKKDTMFLITCAVTVLAVLGTISIAIISLVKSITDGIDIITKALLPLWGTWFGTILAFYFSKENLDTVTEANKDLIGKLSERDQQFASISVSVAMLPFDKIESLNIKDDGDKLLSDIIARKKFKSHNRFPIFTNKNDKILKYIVHRSVIFEYLYNKKGGGKLEDFLREEEEFLIDSVGFVTETATLLDVKSKMDNRENCEDVFVTKDGKKSSEVIGWISDRDIYNKYGKG